MRTLWITVPVLLFTAFWGASGCTNDPYPRADAGAKILYSSFREAPRTLDPAVAYTVSAHEITGKVYDTLLEYHYLKRPFTLIPGLASALPEREETEDGRVSYLFRLREGLLFQDDPAFGLSAQGATTREVAAEDIAFALARIADPEVTSPVIRNFEKISGFAAFGERLRLRREEGEDFRALPVHEQYRAAGGIDGVRIEGRYRLRIVLDAPYPQILYWFAMPFTSPVPWEAISYYDGEEGRPHFAEHPVGTGPFRLARYDKQYRIVLERNPNWYGALHPEWRAEAALYPSDGAPGDLEKGLLDPAYRGRPLPFIERIEYRREKEGIPAFTKFLQGYYDVSGIVNESFDRVVREDRLSPDMAARGMTLEKTVTPTIFYIGFNMDDEVVGRAAGERARKLRQAMSLVVDVGEFARLFMNGRGIPAQSPIPPGVFGYDPRYRNPYRAVDVARARTLLAEAGYPGGVDPETGAPLTLSFDSYDTTAQGFLRYQFFVNAWREIGLDVRINATNYNQFQEKVRNGAYQIFLWGWVADYPDPENFLFLLTAENGRTASGGPNTANFSDPRYDRLFEEMKALDNTERRAGLIADMRGILEEERPWIELYHREDYVLHHAWIRNLKPTGMSFPIDKYIDIGPAQRAALREEWNEPVLWPAYGLLALLVIAIGPAVVTFYRERQ